MAITATVLGAEPANLLSIIHFAINGLKESFAGLDFDVHVPCPVCVVKRNKDADMFSLKQTIRRANELGVQYLQCRSYFHQIPTTSFLAELPASSPEDYRLRMEAALQAVKLLKSALQTPFFISHSKHTPADAAAAKYIQQFLTQYDIQSYLPVIGQTDLDVDVAALNSSQYFLLIVSETYCKSDECVAEVTYIKKQLKRPVIPIPTTGMDNWIQSQVGMLVGNLLWIQYAQDNNFKELLLSRCRKYINGMDADDKQNEHKEPKKAMLSYCWANSMHALEAKQVPSVVGYADPRLIKNGLETAGVATWLDIENLGYESDKGLFDGILEGLKQARVVVACVSNQYAVSANCRMEFQYALKMLRKPVIMAVVGANDGASCWEESEVGLLSNHCPFFGTRCPTVDFRSVYDSNSFNSKLDEVISLVKDALEQLDARVSAGLIVEEKKVEEDDHKKQKSDNAVQAFREQAENIRRSFLLSIADHNQSQSNIPRLILLLPDGLRVMCESISGFHLLDNESSKILISRDELEPLLANSAVMKYQNAIWEILDTIELDQQTRHALNKVYTTDVMHQLISKFSRQKDAGTGLEIQGLTTLQKLWRKATSKRDGDVGGETDSCLTHLILPTKEKLMLCATHFSESKTNVSISSFLSKQ
eukprot:c21592_g1_i3.p1 GENE.c21592_g1_i3~~c21592_g1_i3.p1  ORF type:complete len:649 (+),score=321.59 c21592_g1_i3:33-1979(+)